MLRTPINAAIALYTYHPQTLLFRNQPLLTSFSMFVNNCPLFYFAAGLFVCHSLSALLQKLICNLFVRD